MIYPGGDKIPAGSQLKKNLKVKGTHGFSPTRRAFGVLTVRIENRIVCHGVGGSPPHEPGSPDDPNLVPPIKQLQNNDPEMVPTLSQKYMKM